MMNYFDEAIIKNELVEFATGQGEYFIPDREYGGHSVIQSWINHVLPLIEIKGKDYVNKAIEEMFKELVSSMKLDIVTKNESLLQQLHVYYYLDSEKRIEANKFRHLSSVLEESLNDYINYLGSINDPNKARIIGDIDRIKKRRGL